MNKDDYQQYLQSSHWCKIKAQYRKRYQRVCYLCSSRDNLQLHHVTYDRIREELLTDLVYLCVNCHSFIHQDSKEARELRAWINPVLRPAQGINEKDVTWSKDREAMRPAKKKGKTSQNNSSIIVTIGVYKDAYSVMFDDNAFKGQVPGEGPERTLIFAIIDACAIMESKKVKWELRRKPITIKVQDKSLLPCLENLKQYKTHGWKAKDGRAVANTDLLDRVLGFCSKRNISFAYSDNISKNGRSQDEAINTARSYWNAKTPCKTRQNETRKDRRREDGAEDKAWRAAYSASR